LKSRRGRKNKKDWQTASQGKKSKNTPRGKYRRIGLSQARWWITRENREDVPGGFTNKRPGPHSFRVLINEPKVKKENQKENITGVGGLMGNHLVGGKKRASHGKP